MKDFFFCIQSEAQCILGTVPASFGCENVWHLAGVLVAVEYTAVNWLFCLVNKQCEKDGRLALE